MDQETFLKLFSQVAEEEKGSLPTDPNSPEYEAWMNRISDQVAQRALREGAVKGKEEDGTAWVMIQPSPGFVVKTWDKGSGKKMFLNLCGSDKIKPAVPLLGDSAAEGEGEMKYKVPLSSGSVRSDIDKQGSSCLVCDVVFNHEMIERAKNESEFQVFMITLAIETVKQKSGLDLDDKYILPKLTVKGKLEPQRVRVDTTGKQARKLGDLNLPHSKDLPTETSATQRGGHTLIQEIDLPTTTSTTTTGDQASPDEEGVDIPLQNVTAKPITRDHLRYTVEMKGSFDWSLNKSTLPKEKAEKVPAEMIVNITINEEANITDILPKIELQLIEIQCKRTERCVLSIPLPHPHAVESAKAKFFKKKRLLQIHLTVHYSDIMVEDLLQEMKAATLLSQQADHTVAQYKQAHEKLLLEQRTAEEEEAKRQLTERVLRERALKRLKELEQKAKEDAAAKEKEVEERIQKNVSADSEFRTVLGKSPQHMKDLFGLNLKNRYLFALDSDL